MKSSTVANPNMTRKIYNPIQITLFICVLILSMLMIYTLTLPFLENFFLNFLHGKVLYSGEMVPYSMNDKENLTQTNYWTAWAVDIYIKTPSEARYWFNPIATSFLPALLFSFCLSIAITSLLPKKYGYIQLKIIREINNTINKITYEKYGFISDLEVQSIRNELIQMEHPELRDYCTDLSYSYEDMKNIQKALWWEMGSFGYKLTHINDGITMYMRFHFTFKYQNAVLGFVYIGAAVLIIIVGLRGLKFIPPTQPSLILFSLGLEFSLLITYAMTLMYSRQEEEGGEKENTKIRHSTDNGFKGNFKDSKELEKLLRIFIKTGEKNNKV